jgi:hypothetical protein
MTYSIELSPEEDQLLRQRAAETGQREIDLIVAAVRHENQRIAHFAERRKVLADNFSRLGTSDDELAEELEVIKHSQFLWSRVRYLFIRLIQTIRRL